MNIEKRAAAIHCIPSLQSKSEWIERACDRPALSTGMVFYLGIAALHLITAVEKIQPKGFISGAALSGDSAIMKKRRNCSADENHLIITSCRCYSTAGDFSWNFTSARRTSSSYKVQASAELRAFLPIRKPRPSKRLRAPSSLTIRWPATNMLRYLSGINCNLVFTASNGFVMVVANMAARTPDRKLVEIDDDVVPKFVDCRSFVRGVILRSWLKRRFNCS